MLPNYNLFNGAPKAVSSFAPQNTSLQTAVPQVDYTNYNGGASGSWGDPVATAPVAQDPTPTPDSAVAGVAQTFTNPASSGYGNSAPSNGANVYRTMFDSQLANLDGQISDAQKAFEANNQRVNNSYGLNLNNLNQQRDQGLANYNNSQAQFDLNKANSFRSLHDQLRGLVNSYQNQLGAYGAGDSSAAPMLSYAITQQGNGQAANMNDSYGLQQTGLENQRKGLDLAYNTGKSQLDDYKANMLQQILNSYAPQINSLNSAKTSALGNKALYLQNTDGAAAQSALQQLIALDNAYKSGGTGLNTAMGQAAAPTADLSAYQNFNVQPAQQVQFSAPTIASNQSQDFSPYVLRRPSDNNL